MWYWGSAHDLHACVQIVDASILKQYIFQKSFITEAAKAKREVEAQAATLQAGFFPCACPAGNAVLEEQSSCWHVRIMLSGQGRSCAQVTGAVGWRKDSIKYKKNEVFLDIVEQARPFWLIALPWTSVGGLSGRVHLKEAAAEAQASRARARACGKAIA